MEFTIDLITLTAICTAPFALAALIVETIQRRE